MKIEIRRAQKKDCDALLRLLKEVLELHAKIRPDIFISGTTKYRKEELFDIVSDPKTPVFVAEGEDGEIKGYAFCKILQPPFSTNMQKIKTLFIDDLCVDENCRGEKVGKRLFEYVKEFAKDNGCYDVTLNVWAGNDNAIAFYKKMGMFVKETQMEILVNENKPEK